jgi:acid stress-induced BolA-like protein IbaG/YrbA
MAGNLASRCDYVNRILFYIKSDVWSIKMTIDEIGKKLEAGIEGSVVSMEGDGCSCSTKVVSPVFEGMSLLSRQKMVLAIMREEIDSGALHALSIKARTPAEDT